MTADTVPPATRSRRETKVMLATVVVAALGLILAGVLVENARGGYARERGTLPAVVLMALGFVGPVVAGLTIRRWWRRATGPAGRVTPGLFLTAWLVAAAVFAASPDGTWKPVLPFTPTFTIRYEADGQPHFQARGAFGGSEEQRGERRSDGVIAGDIAVGYQVFPNAAGVRAIEFEGSASPPDRRPQELRGTLTLAERARLRVEGLAGATLLIDDRPTELPILLEPGSYQVVVRGSPGP